MLKNSKLNIIVSNQAEHLGKLLKKDKSLKLIFLDKNKDNKSSFPDNESYIRISGVNKLSGRVVVLHSGCPNPNDGLVELEMILNILNTNKKIKKEVFFSYFPYSQQDKSFRDGETNCAENIIKKLINYYKVQKIYVIDAHFQKESWTKKYPICYVSAINLLKDVALQQNPDLVFLTPDAGAQRRTGLKGSIKNRINSYCVKINNSDHLKKIFKNNQIAVIDDIIETGGTLNKFYNMCLQNGAKKICALITHGVLPSGIIKIKNKYSKLYISNTIYNQDVSGVDVCKLISEHLMKK